MNKIAGVVILYYPANTVLRNIKSYLPKLDKLFIIDNTPENNKAFGNKLQESANIIYKHDGENKGIATRLNEAAALAIKEGYDWLLTMDQDSFFDEDSLDKYLSCVSQFDKAAGVAMFGVMFTNQSTENISCSFRDINQLITSGSLVNLKTYTNIGGFDENLFIDEVDFEFCLRAITKGYLVIQFTHIFLHHQLGVVSYHRSLKNTKVTSRTLHSPIRSYYLTRNFLYIKDKYNERFKTDIDFKKKALLNRYKNNILYNKDRWKVIRFIIRGYLDYRKKRMGKF